MERASAPTPSTPKRTRKIEVTEENVQRLFGMGMRELFKKLAEKFGYYLGRDDDGAYHLRGY